MLTDDELKKFKEDGYLIKSVLSESEINSYRELIKTHIDSQNDKMMNIQFMSPDIEINGIQRIINNKKIIEICGDLLTGGKVILDGASLFYAPKGIDYRQGWHRDIIQIPDEDISDSWFSKEHFHNNVQINIPLYEDKCLWFVKGSHSRNFNDIEMEVFSGSNKIAPLKLPDINIGDNIVLKPGEAIFYNNLAIHRVYGGILMNERATIQLGYHTNKYEPTCHFGVINYHKFDESYINSLNEEVKNTIIEHISERKKWYKSEYYYNLHQDFIRSQFDILVSKDEKN
ncbi:hypothetical protein [Photorhabdus heterorhabditis]|uniref:hypothetical protein n=1 Tax=Photorhabdus heterorhabditis TaxID=880156 RepID=UPI001562D12A|nr:hypothetical protein [Photorhabdus heterorhabditis]NRN30113.1 hypothetical protein [Photorhabdus heterorhabditis subsp. aluminescens]